MRQLIVARGSAAGFSRLSRGLSSSDSDDDLAEVAATLQVAIRLGSLVESKYPIDDRANLLLFEEAVHVLEVRARPDIDAIEPDVPGQQRKQAGLRRSKA